MGTGVETYFTIDELAKYLNYAEKTIRKWVLNREIPFHKIHKSIRFRLSEIEKWVDGGGVQAAVEENETSEGGEMNNEQLAMSNEQRQEDMSNGDSGDR
jgi:excisionase family DNA binding protein